VTPGLEEKAIIQDSLKKDKFILLLYAFKKRKKCNSWDVFH